MKVRDVVSPDLISASEDVSIAEVSKLMRDNHIGCVPILRNGQLTGLITDRDIVKRVIAEGLDPEQERVSNFMTRDNLIWCSPDTDVEEASRIMAQYKIRRLPIVENDMCTGMVSLGDLSMAEERELAGETLKEISEPTIEERIAA